MVIPRAFRPEGICCSLAPFLRRGAPSQRSVLRDVRVGGNAAFSLRFVILSEVDGSHLRIVRGVEGPMHLRPPVQTAKSATTLAPLSFRGPSGPRNLLLPAPPRQGVPHPNGAIFATLEPALSEVEGVGGNAADVEPEEYADALGRAWLQPCR